MRSSFERVYHTVIAIADKVKLAYYAKGYVHRVYDKVTSAK